MRSLLTWRATSRGHYDFVRDELQMSLQSLAHRFMPDTTLFLSHLLRWKAMVMGEAALSFVLHDPTICPAIFELATGSLAFIPFVHGILSMLSSTDYLHSHCILDAPTHIFGNRFFQRIAQFHLTDDRAIVIYESTTTSPSSVVAGFWSSMMMNFVTPYSMGCAYPSLTFHHHGILCEERMSTLGWPGHDLMNRLVARRWTFGRDSSDWPPLVNEHTEQIPGLIAGCGRSIFGCPHQGRYFGDQGSLVVFLDALGDARGLSRAANIAPYGLMSAWRIPFPEPCEEECRDLDDVVPAEAVCMLMQFVDDDCYPLPRFYHAVTRAACGCTVVFPPAQGRARAYSF